MNTASLADMSATAQGLFAPATLLPFACPASALQGGHTRVLVAALALLELGHLVRTGADPPARPR